MAESLGLAPSLPAGGAPNTTTGPAAPRRARRTRKPRQATPDGLKTTEQAATKLGCSIKTLNGHVASGTLPYVQIGHGKKRPRKMFTDADLNAFVANQTRKEIPTCPS